MSRWYYEYSIGQQIWIVEMIVSRKNQSLGVKKHSIKNIMYIPITKIDNYSDVWWQSLSRRFHVVKFWDQYVINVIFQWENLFDHYVWKPQNDYITNGYFFILVIICLFWKLLLLPICGYYYHKFEKTKVRLSVLWSRQYYLISFAQCFLDVYAKTYIMDHSY